MASEAAARQPKDSDGTGHGSSKAPQAAPAHPAAKAAPSRQLHVLLVEDNRADARLIQLQLEERRGLHVDLDVVTRLDDALERLDRTNYDIMLLDLSLPDAQGLESVERVRAVGPQTPIVVLTGLEDGAVAVQAVRSGAQDYLIKGSVEPADLERAIQYAIERQHAFDEVEHVREQVANNEMLAALGAVVSGLAQEIEAASAGVTQKLYELRREVEHAAASDPEMTGLVERVADVSVDVMGDVHHIDRVVADLRRFTGTGREARRAEQLDQVAKRAVDLLRATSLRQVNVVSKLTATPTAPMNGPAIQQVVLSLLTNARDASPPDAPIEVGTDATDEAVSVHVTDHGTGIAPYVAERMFEPFFTTKEGGTGLGLTVAKRIAEDHAGRLLHEDLDNGGGTRFTLWLPRAAPG